MSEACKELSRTFTRCEPTSIDEACACVKLSADRHLYTVDASGDTVLGMLAEGTELSVFASVDWTTISSDSSLVGMFAANAGFECTEVCVADSVCILEEPS